jgi:hypothetical protein
LILVIFRFNFYYIPEVKKEPLKMENQDNSKEVCKFKMGLKGGGLPDGFSCKIEVELDFEGVEREELIRICSGGQTTRVALQSQLRKKSVRELTKLEAEGLKVSFGEVYKKEIVKPVDKLLALNKTDFVEMMVQGMGLNSETAGELWEKNQLKG